MIASTVVFLHHAFENPPTSLKRGEEHVYTERSRFEEYHAGGKWEVLG